MARKKKSRSKRGQTLKKDKKKKKNYPEHFFIPIFGLLGLAIGYYYSYALAGLILGLGIGFLIEGIIKFRG